MKHIKYILKTLFIISGILLLNSCNKYLDKNPLDSPSLDNFYSNATEANQGLTGVYNAISAEMAPTNKTPIYSKFDLFTEIGMERKPGYAWGDLATGSYLSNNGAVAAIWSGFYVAVSRANSFIYGVQKAKSKLAVKDYDRMVAEAKVVRAFAYWHLITFYGDVPFYTEPLAGDQINSIKRTSKATIINFLISDLSDAAKKLDWLPTQTGRVSRGVAMGLSARLAMLSKNYQVVANVTDSIITQGPYSLNPQYKNLFRKAGQIANVGNEIMWVYPYGDSDPGSYSYLYLVQGSRAQDGQTSQAPSQFLVDLFECKDGLTIDKSPLYNPAQPNQNRDSRMKQTVIIPGDTSLANINLVYHLGYYTYKYDITTKKITLSTTLNQDSSSYGVYGARQMMNGNLWRKYSQDRDLNGAMAGSGDKVGWVFMRYAEILLLNAEAYVELGNLSKAAVSINKVRARAGMPAITSNDVAELRRVVRREKMVELANEGLHLADMRRWDDGAYANKVMNGILYGESTSSMVLVANKGLQFTNPAPAPLFDATLGVPVDWTNGATKRLYREQRFFILPKHLAYPIPQGEIDKNHNLTQNTGY
jgi:hypothetical protein